MIQRQAPSADLQSGTDARADLQSGSTPEPRTNIFSFFQILLLLLLLLVLLRLSDEAALANSCRLSRCAGGLAFAPVVTAVVAVAECAGELLFCVPIVARSHGAASYDAVFPRGWVAACGMFCARDRRRRYQHGALAPWTCAPCDHCHAPEDAGARIPP
jgi:hypothetical protein